MRWSGLLFGIFTLLGLLLSGSVSAFQGRYGAPYIRNVLPEEYNGLIQNWHTAQTEKGLIYVANLGGILEYDGVKWRNISLPNTTALSVGVSDDTLFVGGVNEIGYLGAPSNDSTYYPEYYSLTGLLPDSQREFGDVWQVLPTSDGVFFRTNKYLFKYSKGKFTTWEAETGFHFAFYVNGSLFVNIRKKGLHRLIRDQLSLVNGGEDFANDGIYAMLPYADGIVLMATRFKNLVLFDGSAFRSFESEANAFLENNRLYNGLALRDGTFTFGTLRGGFIHIDRFGNVLNIINKNNGLLTDVIYHLFEDLEGNIWVSQNRGLSIVHQSLPVAVFDERHGLAGMPRSIIGDTRRLFIGTDQGLFVHFKVPSKDPYLQQIPDFTHAVLDLTFHGNSVLAATQSGLWRIDGASVRQLNSIPYIRCITPSDQHAGLYYLGTQDGVYLVQEKQQELEVLGNIGGIESEVTTIVEDKYGNVWAGAPANGLYQLQWTGSNTPNLNPSVRKWMQEGERAKVFKVNGEAVFGFKRSFLQYDPVSDTLIHFQSIDESSPVKMSPGVFMLAEDAMGNLWMRNDEQNVRAQRLSDGTYRLGTSPLRLIRSEQFNFIYPDEQGAVWYGVGDGLIRYDASKPFDYEMDYRSFVREVLIRNDSLIFAGTAVSDTDPVFEYADNELRFRYAAASYVLNDELQYQVYLEGFDKDWSNWTTEVQKDYTNIPEGNYTFHVRAKNIFDHVSKADTYSFTILPPWYRTIWAYLSYVLLVGSVVYGAHRFRINNILREQRVRNRIAGDLHDEVSATLSSISYFAQAIRQTDGASSENRFVNLISESASEAKEKITDIIWSIDPENDDWINLLSKCRRYASDVLESKNIEYELDITQDIPAPLDVELRQHLWLIFKEMVTNAARHSGASKVSIEFGYSSGVLRLLVQDNGGGFNVEQVHNGHGVKSIKQRAQKIKADIALESDEEIGTRWTMKVRF